MKLSNSQADEPMSSGTVHLPNAAGWTRRNASCVTTHPSHPNINGAFLLVLLITGISGLSGWFGQNAAICRTVGDVLAAMWLATLVTINC